MNVVVIEFNILQMQRLQVPNLLYSLLPEVHKGNNLRARIY